MIPIPVHVSKMSTPSSSTRRPPISPQVTASVVKFRCLYSHDLRRKSKRWHDGHLRYHKHNKRVMVYDDQGNFIGDHHWRSLDEVQDGDEMELDKGVLIEVGENMGITETDISNLYEKKRSSQGSPQGRDPVPSVPRASAATPTPRYGGSSQSFRSLNDLLGIKKTPVNPFASPYEQRNPVQAAPRAAEPERAPKRQKISAPSQITEGPRIRSQTIDLTESNPERNPTRVSNSSASQLARAGGNSTVQPLTGTPQGPALSQRVHPPRPNPPTSSGRSVPAASQSNASLPSLEGPIRPSTRPVAHPRPSNIKTTPAPPAPPERTQGSSHLSNRPAPPRPSNSRTTPAPPAQPERTPETLPDFNSAAPSEREPSRPRGTLHTHESSRIRENRPKIAPPKPPVPTKPPAPSKQPTQRPVPPQPEDEVSNPVEAPRPRATAVSKEPAITREDREQSAQQPMRPQGRPSVPNSPPLTSPAAPVSRPTAASSSPTVSSGGPANTTNVPSPSNMPPPARPLPRKPSEPSSGGLRMSSGRPRKKLMYSALLPGTSQTSSPTTSSSPSGSADNVPTVPQEPQSVCIFELA